MTDYRKKYLDSFFKWQEIYAKAEKRIEELEKENKKLKELLNGKELCNNFSDKDFLHNKSEN